MKYNLKKLISVSIIVICLSFITVFAYTARPADAPGVPTGQNTRGPVTTSSITDYRPDPIAFGKSTAPTTGANVDINGVLSVTSGLFSFANTVISGFLVTGNLTVDNLKGTSVQTLQLSPGQKLSTGSFTGSPAIFTFTTTNCNPSCTWIVPAGVHVVRVEAWGGGGGGRYDDFYTSTTDGSDSSFSLGGTQIVLAKGGQNSNINSPINSIGQISIWGGKPKPKLNFYTSTPSGSWGEKGGNSYGFNNAIIGSGGSGGFDQISASAGSGFGAGGGEYIYQNIVSSQPTSSSGAGGSYASSVINVTPSQTYTIVVGNGGSAYGARAGAGADGGIVLETNLSTYYTTQ